LAAEFAYQLRLHSGQGGPSYGKDDPRCTVVSDDDLALFGKVVLSLSSFLSLKYLAPLISIKPVDEPLIQDYLA
jgi:hypothetical protein